MFPKRWWASKLMFYGMIIGVMLLLQGCSGGELSQITPIQDIKTKIPSGTIIDNELDLSDLTPTDAQFKLKKWGEDKLVQNLNLVYNEAEVQFSLRELGIALDFDKTWNQVKSGFGRAVSSVLKVDTLKANQSLNSRLEKFTRPAKDATYKIENDRFVITPALPGISISTDQIISKIAGLSFKTLPDNLKVSFMEIPASVTTESLQDYGFDSVIGEFTTKFSVNEENRSYNLREAAKKLDQKLIKPGEIFSFNDTVGPRTAETGFKDAYIIKNNEYVQGIGGGICQVSSTLYNAVLFGNLQVIERYPHAVTIAYVPLGQDATVNYPNLDFKFKNDTPSLVYLRTEVKPGAITIRIYGKKTDKSVRIEHEIEKEIDFQVQRRVTSDLPPGKVKLEQPGSKGYKVKTYKILKDKSGVETKQLISTDTYAPSKRIYSVGVD